MYGEEQKDEIVQLSLDDIIPNRFQPREVFDERALKELAVSIREHGVIQPIIVRNVNGKYEIIAGERRYKASALAGQTKIPAIIRDLDDKESSKVALLENLQRKNLNAIEEARTYQKILEIDEMTQEELAKTMGKSQSAVANKLRLLNLPEEVQEALLKEKISERHARALLTVPDPQQQKTLLNKVMTEKISVRKLEEEINVLYPKPKKAEDIPVEENATAIKTEFLNDQPLTPTATDIKEESSNYGKVVIAPPTEGNDEEGDGNTENIINYGEIGKEDNNTEDEGFSLPETAPTVDVEEIKSTAEDINKEDNESKSEIDGLLNLTSGPITPAEKIVKETTDDIKSSEDYFKQPDLAAIEIPAIDSQQEEKPIIEITEEGKEIPETQPIEEKQYTVDEAKEKIDNLIEEIRKSGIKINADEMNFPKSYQIIIKIDKEQ